jgi:hypothetical protein
MCCIVSEQLVDLQIQFARRSKEEGENWRQRTRNPSVPVGSAIAPKTSLGSWAGLFPLLLLSIKRAVWHTPTGTMLGMKSRFLRS